MTEYRLISSPAHFDPPAEIDLTLAPEYRAYMAHPEERLILCQPADVADTERYLRGNGNHVERGPSLALLPEQLV